LTLGGNTEYVKKRNNLLIFGSRGSGSSSEIPLLSVAAGSGSGVKEYVIS
jgi:predicted AAA+ superfamily ATPase